MSKWIVDLSPTNKAAKEKFLSDHPNDFILMDLTCFDPEDFYSRFPQLKGVCSTLFSKNGKCEAHFREDQAGGIHALKENGFEATITTIITPGFVVARTLSTIINEAFYSLEDKIATAEDIDRAMCFGVNYPYGPFEWAQGREQLVVWLLETLLAKTNDERYRPSPRLLK
ncbi:MAG: hypothetical protein K2P81_10555 [Bacteriovoracaceae bacterium]|nr:hypothetical protein [Bacteriovoracaceae bacterium]